jgi:uracil-DNA glycosylase family 4
MGKISALAALSAQYHDCQMCPLSQTRTHVVFGAGNPDARLMFVGEAPGFDEDRQGLPFVGAAGQLLTKIIEAMKLTREEVYIANCLKCRPPGNRNPLPSEIAACGVILSKQIAIIQPKIICALGKFAAQTLLKTDEPISRLRGRFFDWDQGIRLMPTFHPAYLLRNPGDKKLVWQDMKMIMAELEVN